jgi:hypothetical protein
LGLSVLTLEAGIMGFGRLLVLSLAFPIGSLLGRLAYLKWSHIEITYDDEIFRVLKGGNKISEGSWKNYRVVSIVLDQLGRPSIRLYQTSDSNFVDIPISKAKMPPQEFRDRVKILMSNAKRESSTLQVVEVS